MINLGQQSAPSQRRAFFASAERLNCNPCMPPVRGTMLSNATEMPMIRLSPMPDVIFVPPSLKITSVKLLIKLRR